MTSEWSWVGHFQSHDMSGLQVQPVCAIMIEIGGGVVSLQKRGIHGVSGCATVQQWRENLGVMPPVTSVQMINQVSMYGYGDV